MSVPSIFARLYELADAFSLLNSEYPTNMSFVRKAEREVSCWLDLIELILMYGSSLKISRVGIEDFEYLCQSTDVRHQLLGSLLKEDYCGNHLFGHIDDLYLFSWEDIVLGGASPLTAVYTRPDIYRYFYREIYGMCGNRLFHDVVPLIHRNIEFRKFMYVYTMIYGFPNPIRDYTRRCMDMDDCRQIVQGIGHLPDFYMPMRNLNGEPILSNDIPVFYISDEEKVRDSDYLIQPSKIVNERLPLVLSESGLSNGRYFLNLSWNYNFRLTPEITNAPMENRILPGTNIKYPFISISDLLEDKIIRLPNDVDSKNFVTCTFGKSQYLLPIKGLIFKYFNIENIEELVKIDEFCEKIRVSLRIPVKGGHIVFTKLYDEVDIVEWDFNIAFIPLYRIQGDNLRYDESTKIFFISRNDIDLDFCNDDTSLSHECITQTIRYRNSGYEEVCCSINKRWEYIVISISVDGFNDKIKGIIIPQFRQIYLTHEDCIFSVEMDDDYSKIRHSKQSLPAKDLCINRFDEESITSILCPDNIEFKSLINKYTFICHGPAIRNLTFKNAIWVTKDVEHDPSMGRFFENYNLAFDHEDFKRKDEIMLRLSMMDLNNSKAIKFLRLYFEGLLYVMKQKAIYEYQCSEFDLVVAVPTHLSKSEKNVFKKLWAEARKNSKTDIGKQTKFISKSEVLAASTYQNLPLNHSFVNINIDSVHTTISHCDEAKIITTFTIDMGIRNLLSDPYDFLGRNENYARHIVQNYLVNNGFYTTEEVQKLFLNIGYNNWSLFDIFENNSKFESSSNFLNCGRFSLYLMQIFSIFMHGLFRYVEKCIAQFELKSPQFILFSGIGSKYISSLIERDPEMNYLSNAKFFRNQDSSQQKSCVLVYLDEYQNRNISDYMMSNVSAFTEKYECCYGLDDNMHTLTLIELLDLNLMDRITIEYRDLLLNCESSLDLLGKTPVNIKGMENMASNSIHRCLDEYLQNHIMEEICNRSLSFWSQKYSLYDWLRQNC